MKVHEYIAKDIFKKEGIPVPQNKMVVNPDEARAVAMEMGKPVVIKSQILVGGRGKAGGIKFDDKCRTKDYSGARSGKPFVSA